MSNRITADLRALIDELADPKALVVELVRLACNVEREEMCFPPSVNCLIAAMADHGIR